MKKFIICLCLILTVGGMYGCGKEKDDERMDTQAMQAYIGGFFDLRYKGQLNDNYKLLTNITEEDGKRTHENYMNQEVKAYLAPADDFQYEASESQKKRIYNLYEEIYKRSDFKVGTPKKISDTKWVCEITSSPFELFYTHNSVDIDKMHDELDLYLIAHPEIDMKDQDRFNKIYASFYIDYHLDALEEYVYSDTPLNTYKEQTVEITVEYGKIQKGKWSIDDKDIFAVDKIVLSYDDTKPDNN